MDLGRSWSREVPIPAMTALVVVAPCAVIAFALWLEDRRRRDRDAELVGEIRACRREVAELHHSHITIPEAWKDTR
jgi:hypothetical protein